jgi:hypothetical protein
MVPQRLHLLTLPQQMLHSRVPMGNQRRYINRGRTALMRLVSQSASFPRLLLTTAEELPQLQALRPAASPPAAPPPPP